jgi:hypothetical protein
MPGPTVLDPGETLYLRLNYAPLFPGSFTDELVLDTTAGEVRVRLAASATATLMPSTRRAPIAGRSATPTLRDLRVRPVRGTRRHVHVSYRLSAAAAVDLGIVRQTPRNRCADRARGCPRLRSLAWRRTLDGHAGLNRARVMLPSLSPGRYRLLATARADDGATGGRRSARFRIPMRP